MIRFAINFKNQQKRGREFDRALISAGLGAFTAEFIISPRAVCAAAAAYAALLRRKSACLRAGAL
jgi:hypothetical protein